MKDAGNIALYEITELTDLLLSGLTYYEKLYDDTRKSVSKRIKYPSLTRSSKIEAAKDILVFISEYNFLNSLKEYVLNNKEELDKAYISNFINKVDEINFELQKPYKTIKNIIKQGLNSNSKRVRTRAEIIMYEAEGLRGYKSSDGNKPYEKIDLNKILEMN